MCVGRSLEDVLGSQMSLHLGVLSMDETEPHASVAWGRSCFSLPTPVCEGVPALREADLHSHSPLRTGQRARRRSDFCHGPVTVQNQPYPLPHKALSPCRMGGRRGGASITDVRLVRTPTATQKGTCRGLMRGSEPSSAGNPSVQAHSEAGNHP